MSIFKDASVLLTGGTGSFGKMFLKLALAELGVRRIIVFSRDELKQFEMQRVFTDERIRYFIGDVRDAGRLDRAMRGVDLVVHAAALKQVPAAEYNPIECIKTNVLGAENVINACIDAGVKRVVTLSTDKAVNPINLYGATKLCSDKLFTAANHLGGPKGTRFASVRYGNVVGSRGSVIPFFQEQKKQGWLPITDPRMTRFWITIEDGARFVAQSMEIMQGGEIFVPKIKTMRITDLATAMAPDCEQRVVGIRPGEKLHEVLVPRDEARSTLEFSKFYLIGPSFQQWGRDGAPSYMGETGKPVSDDFQYASDDAGALLGKADLMHMIDTASAE